jgi:methyl-accepting chemotaxis protein
LSAKILKPYREDQMISSAGKFDNEMNQISIASIDVLMQLVQVMEAMRETQSALLRLSGNLVEQDAKTVNELLAEANHLATKSDRIADQLPTRVQTLVDRIQSANAKFGPLTK